MSKSHRVPILVVPYDTALYKGLKAWTGVVAGYPLQTTAPAAETMTIHPATPQTATKLCSKFSQAGVDIDNGRERWWTPSCRFMWSSDVKMPAAVRELVQVASNTATGSDGRLVYQSQLDPAPLQRVQLQTCKAVSDTPQKAAACRVFLPTDDRLDACTTTLQRIAHSTNIGYIHGSCGN